MAAPALRHYSNNSLGTTTTTLVTVPAGRALAISKIVVTATGSTLITLTIGGTSIAVQVPMATGQVYTETGLVALAGETVTALSTVTNTCQVSVFGEEVDN